METNDLSKPEIRVSWTAPESGSGCVVFRASIVEASKQWFSEDDLVKKLCEQNEGSTDVQPDILDTCNACTEAKYEVAHCVCVCNCCSEVKLGIIVGYI